MTTLSDLAVDSLTINGASVATAVSAPAAFEVIGALTADSTSHLIGAVTADASLAVGTTTHLVGAVTCDGAVTITGALSANGGIAKPTPTAYDGGSAPGKAILPTNSWATLTKGSAGNDYTLAAPGAGNVGRSLRVTSTGAYAHVVTVTGLLGGTTMTFAAAIGNGFVVFAVSATVWVLESNNGCTQTA